MKDLMTIKRVINLEGYEKFQHCKAITTISLVQKKEDARAFIIPCTIGTLQFPKALCELGSSINFMPLSVLTKIGLGDPNPTTMCLLMGD